MSKNCKHSGCNKYNKYFVVKRVLKFQVVSLVYLAFMDEVGLQRRGEIYLKLDTRIFVPLFARTLAVPTLYSKTGWTGELWSNTNHLKLQN